MRNPGGYATWINPDRPMVERDTFSCCHCGFVTHVKPGLNHSEDQVEMGFCRPCMKPICKRCVGKGCTPMERWLEEQEARARFLASVG